MPLLMTVDQTIRRCKFSCAFGSLLFLIAFSFSLALLTPRFIFG